MKNLGFLFFGTQNFQFQICLLIQTICSLAFYLKIEHFVNILYKNIYLNITTFINFLFTTISTQ